MVKEAVRQEEGEDEPPSSIMPTYLSKAWAPLWGAHLALLFYHPLASTLAQGLLEKMSQQCAYWCRVCVCVCVAVGVGVGGSQPASFFQDMGKKEGVSSPIPAQRGRAWWAGRSYSLDQPLGSVLWS